MLRSFLVNGQMISYDDPSEHHRPGENIDIKQQAQTELTIEKEAVKDDPVPLVDSGEIANSSVMSAKKKKSRLTL